VDQKGKSADSFLRQRRDVGAAKTFFGRAWKQHGDPLSITLDANAASHRAVPEFKGSGEILYPKMRVRSCAYLHHVVEQDHRGVKRRVNPMLGLQSFEKARVVIAGINLRRFTCDYPVSNWRRRSARDHTSCDGGVAPTRARLRCGSG
jgi:transposase-like protein